MDKSQIKSLAKKIIKKWWASLVILPFAIYSIHHYYWALRYNIFFAVNYDYPFPLGIPHFFIDNFLLIVHEAGHTFFGIFGSRFVTILGGSLFQILLPLLILAFCWVNRKDIGMQFSLCLVGYSWLDVAGYVADGGARQLPLIGGLGKSAHDWHNLLARMNALEHDFAIGVTFMGIGIFCYLASLVLPLFYQEYEKVDLKLGLE